MEPRDLILQYLDEAHATETALVTTLAAHSAMAPEGEYRRLLRRHLDETREQVDAIEARRAELGDDGRGLVATGVGLVRDAVGQGLALTKGPIDAVRARGGAERALKNAKDECATEALEIATYDALEAAAKAANDDKTAKLAADHRRTEERMLDDLRKQLPKLAEAAFAERTGKQTARRNTGSTSGASSTRRGTASRGTTRRTSSTNGARKTGTSSGRSAAKSSGRSSKTRAGSAGGKS